MTEPLSVRIAMLGTGACSCNTKTPDVHMHLATCTYRRVMELADEVEALEDCIHAPASAEATGGGVEEVAIEHFAQWLHSEVDWPDPDFPHATWPEHDADDGQRGAGFVQIVPRDVAAKFRDIARRALITAAQATAAPNPPAAPEAAGGGVAVPEGWRLVPTDDADRPFSDPALPDEMLIAGAEAIDRASDDLKAYIPGETIDWDSGMIAVAVYRAMLAAAPKLPAAPEPPAAPVPPAQGWRSEGVREDVARIIDPHSFIPFDPQNGDETIFGEMVQQDRDLAFRKANRILDRISAAIEPAPAEGGP